MFLLKSLWKLYRVLTKLEITIFKYGKGTKVYRNPSKNLVTLLKMLYKTLGFFTKFLTKEFILSWKSLKLVWFENQIVKTVGVLKIIMWNSYDFFFQFL